MKAKILVIDDEETIRFTFTTFLTGDGHEVATAADYNNALTLLDRQKFDLVFTDILLGNNTGIDVLKEIKKRNLPCPVVLITGYPDIKSALDALRLGVFDYIPKPVLKDTLLRVTNMALQHKTLLDEKEQFRSNLEAIFRSVKDAIVTVSEDSMVLGFNEAAKSMCNLPRDAVGKPFDSFPKKCSGKCREALNETLEKKTPVEICRIECKHIHRPLQVVTVTTNPLLSHSGKFSGVVLVIRDETHLDNLERNRKERQQLHNILGKSDKMRGIYSLIEDLADVQTNVLITGETGTGKELVAEALHHMGERRHKPLVRVSCSTLSENLLESELFGHVKGAFTGAVQGRVGRFQRADGGTIFLDEISEISSRTQVQLLRVLQEREFEKVGDSTPIKVDVRVIAATNQNLKDIVMCGKFREDLYYRLKVVEINMPPLRERREDIPLLVSYFLNKFNRKLSKNIMHVSADVQKLFMEYPWPGNVRELEHTLEHAFILCHQKTITVDHLPFSLKNVIPLKTSFTGYSENDEPQVIIDTLKKTGWSKVRTSRLLGISRTTLYRKIRQHKIVNKHTNS